MRLHYIQHVPFEHPGIILEWAREHNHVLSDTQIYQGYPLPSQEDFDWLIVMGGPMNIYEEDKYPWLKQEKVFISQSIAAGKIVIGICLGAQLIADVLGGKVTANREKEIGWLPVSFAEDLQKIPAFSDFPRQMIVFQWHGDTFSELPPNTRNLAGSEGCRQQAFTHGQNVYAFQFHLEIAESAIRDLLLHCSDEMTTGNYSQTPKAILNNLPYLKQMHRYMKKFLDRLESISKIGEIQ